MDMQTGLRLEQKQTLVMTPRLQQALNILQLPTIELQHLLKKEVEQNPVLEINDERPEVSLEEDTVEEWEEYFANSDYEFSQEQHRESKKGFAEDLLTYRISLFDYLEKQMDLILEEEVDRNLARFIVGCLDHRGYLCLPMDEIATMQEVSLERVEKIRSLLMDQDPPGCGALSLREAFLCQLNNLEGEGEASKWAGQIIHKHWGDLTTGNLESIRQKFAAGPEAFTRGISIIKRLYSEPAGAFVRPQTSYLEPDILIVELEGEFRVVMNDHVFPRLGFNRYYSEILRKEGQSQDVRAFLEKKVKAARWLLRCVEQRRLTLYRIAEILLELQGNFFRQGRKALKPMALRDVAERLNLHVSTVCRATTGKYMQTPFGIYEMKYFFNSGVETAGQGFASVSIKEMIKELVEKEGNTPLSDQDIAYELREKEGIEISRRTVAKYRQQLMIPSSNRRRKMV